MLELFKEAVKITNYNIILTIPLILFIKVLDLYTMYSVVNSTPRLLVATLTVLFMFGAFCAGWFYMVKGAIELSKKVFILDTDRANATLNLFKTIPEGIGKYFLSFVGVYAIFFFIQVIATPIVYQLGTHIIGSLDAASMQSLQEMAIDPSITTNVGVAAFIDKLSPEQIIFVGKWSLLFMLITSIIMYLLMLWIPEIIFKTVNPLKALWYSLIKLFKNFFNTIVLFLALWFMGLGILFISSFTILNPLAYIIMSIVMFYFVVYMVVLVFLYYDKKYMVNNEQ
jgi:hypothetical protein